MKTLKSLWLCALLIIGYRTYGLIMRAYNSDFSGNYSGEIDSFVGMVLTFAFLSVVLIIFWVIGRTKEKIIEKITERKSYG